MMKLLSLFVFNLLALWCPAQSQDYIFTEIKTDSVKRSFRKIVIVSFGSVESRFFCENLSGQLLKELKPDSVGIEYIYLGKDAREGNMEFKKVSKENYDAIVTVTPKDSSVYLTTNNTFTNQSSNNAIGQMSITTRSRDIIYSQTFDIQIMEPADQNKILWAASLHVLFDPGKQKVYKSITRKMVSSFKKSKLIQ